MLLMKKLINQTTVQRKVVEWDSSNNILYYIQTRHNDEGVDSNAIKQHLVEQMLLQVAKKCNRTPTTSTSTINNVSFTSGYILLQK